MLYAAASLGVVGAALLYYAFLFGSLDGFVRAVDHCELAFCDFVRHFWPVGREILAEKRAVAPFVYSPFAALFFAPFGQMDLQLAGLLWSGLSGALAIALYRTPAVGRQRDGAALSLVYLAVFVTSMPVLHCFKWGQISIGIALLVLGAFGLYARGFVLTAAALLAASVAFKFYTAFFVVYFVLKGDVRFVVSFGLFALAFLVGIPMAVLGPTATLDFYRDLAALLERLAPGVWITPNPQYGPAVAARLLFADYGASAGWRWGLTLGGHAVVLSSLLLVYLLQRRRAQTVAAERSLEVLLLSLPFLVPTSWPHYLVYLPYCQVQLVRRVLRERAGSGARRIAILSLVSLSVALASVFAYAAVGRWDAYAWSGALFFADLALLVAVWIEVWPSLRVVGHRDGAAA